MLVAVFATKPVIEVLLQSLCRELQVLVKSSRSMALEAPTVSQALLCIPALSIATGLVTPLVQARRIELAISIHTGISATAIVMGNALTIVGGQHATTVSARLWQFSNISRNSFALTRRESLRLGAPMGACFFI